MALGHLRRPVALTRAGMLAERIVVSFWPLWTMGFAGLVPLLAGWHRAMPVELYWAWLVLNGLGGLGAIVWGWRLFRWPSEAEAVGRVDASLKGRPIAAITDTLAIGADDPETRKLWEAHRARMLERSRLARPVEPDLRVAPRDPYGLRLMAFIAFVAALGFGAFGRNPGVDDIGGGTVAALPAGPAWEGWIAPPAYTGKATIYLADSPAGILRVPTGSEITVRLYGDAGALSLSESVSGRSGIVGAATDPVHSLTVMRDGELKIGGTDSAWMVQVIADGPPEVAPSGPVEADAYGEMSQPFRAADDYGVRSGRATIALDLSRVDRRHGLAAEPATIAPIVVDLPMPFSGDRSDFEDLLVENFSQHPLANLPAILTLSVTDGAEQVGQSQPEPIILPGRRFFQPLAKAVAEQRRDLLWSPDNQRRVAQMLRAVSNRPDELFRDDTTYLRLRVTLRRLEAYAEAGMTDAQRDEIALALWELALLLEDGTLADARERLERAQERLAEAIRDGASQEEIAELMQELRSATDEYLDMLAQNAEGPASRADEPDTGDNSMQLQMSELQALMDRIQELMEQDRMAEAGELLEQLNQLMEDMQVTLGGDGEGRRTPGQQSMQDMAEALRDQQSLSDDAFRQLQEQFNAPGQPGQAGREGEAGRDGKGHEQGSNPEGGQQSDQGPGGEAPGEADLAGRQEALRQGLEALEERLPSLDGEAAEAARRAIETAEGAMRGAEDALRQGDLAEAIDRQAEAMNALREGMRELGEAMADDRTNEPGQGDDQGSAGSRPTPAQRDPLGREVGTGGQFASDADALQGPDIYRRAEEILNEIRRRSADQTRTEDERSYLRRLLERF